MSTSEFYKHLPNAYSVTNAMPIHELYSNEKGMPSLCLHGFHKGMKEQISNEVNPSYTFSKYTVREFFQKFPIYMCAH